MYKVGIIGDGYTAAELLRIIAGHDELETVAVTSTENIGRAIAEIYPHLRAFTDLGCEATDLEVLKEKCDAVFLALPHGLSVPMVKELSGAGVKCVDLGADFRLKDKRIYEKYYEIVHEAPEMLAEAVYGIAGTLSGQDKRSPDCCQSRMFPNLSHSAAGTAFGSRGG